jgi:hypothetical protein
MLTNSRGETLPTERIGVIVYILTENKGTKYTTADLAQRVSLQHASMWKMLCKLSRVLPIVQEIDGWYIP